MAILDFPSLDLLSQRLTQILGGLRAMVAARGGREQARVPLLTLAWKRLGRLGVRFEALVARLAAGRPVVPARPRVRAAGVARRPGGELRLPTGKAWLIRMVQETAQYAGQVQAVLDDPEMAALLAASPGAGRILRPLCRMLAIEPGPGLALATARPASVRVRVAKAACLVPPGERPSAISLACAALMGKPVAESPEPVPHKPPWGGRDWSKWSHSSR